jgi:hypothetical protein
MEVFPTKLPFIFQGAEVSEFVKRHFVNSLKQNSNYKKGKYQEALKQTFLEMDKLMLQQKGILELKQILKEGGSEEDQETMAGCTANVSMIVNG